MTRKRDDPWWNYVLMHATLPESFQPVLKHGVDPDVPGEGGYTTLHHLATPTAGRRGSFVPTEETYRLQLAAAQLYDAHGLLSARLAELGVWRVFDVGGRTRLPCPGHSMLDDRHDLR